MRCPRCGHCQEEDRLDCQGCGVVFSRYRGHRTPAGPPARPRAWNGLWQRLFQIPRSESRSMLAGRAIVLVLLAWWGMRLLAAPLDELMDSFLHWIHLPFHEAGHFVFRPFGAFLHILGGTLGQLLVPLICCGAFLREENPFGAAVSVWWLGASFMDCAPYVNDARARVLPLLSGETGQEDWEGHDWYQLLSRTGQLAHDHWFAHLFWLTGATLILAALAWGGYIIWRQAAGTRGE